MRRIRKLPGRAGSRSAVAALLVAEAQRLGVRLRTPLAPDDVQVLDEMECR